MVDFLPAPQDPIGEGIRAGIVGAGDILTQRLQQSAQRRADVTALQQALGLSPEQAQQIVRASPELQKMLLQQVMGAQEPQSLLSQMLLAGRVDQPQDGLSDLLSDPSRQQPVQGGFDPAALSRKELDILAASQFEEDRRLAQAELKQREIEQREKKPFVQADIKRSGKFLEEIDESRGAIQRKSAALNQMQGALEEGNLGFFSKDNLAKHLGRFGKGLVSPEGALLENAAKEFLLGDIERLKGRPNQFIEQRILSMMAEIGKSPEANLSVVEAMKMHVDIEKLRLQKADELEEGFRARGEPVPGNISRLVDKAMQDDVERLENRTAFRLRQIQEAALSVSEMDKLAKKKPRKGTVLTPRMAAALKRQHKDAEAAMAAAKKLGYIIPTAEEAQEFMQ